MQPTNNRAPQSRLHVAIIMDGNGRWANDRGLPRTAGHIAGVNAVRTVVETAARRNIGTLTLYTFSSGNWNRPRSEVSAIMQLLVNRLPAESRRLAQEGIRLSVVGRRDRLADNVLRAIKDAEAVTRAGTSMHLCLAVDYSARYALARAARHLADQHHANGVGESRADTFQRAIAGAYQVDTVVPDVDLLIRTGGEQRLSDFLLWECAYAELYFTPCQWPDFDDTALDEALTAFCGRQRRFGGVVQNSTTRRSLAATPYGVMD